MSLMSALLETYDFALERGLVDGTMTDNKCPALLPVYHSNKKSGGEDIFEITIDKNSIAIDGKFLGKDERIVFPITEDSITRSGSKIAPHALCDELSYLSREIDPLKNEEYLKGIGELLEYEKANNCESFKTIGNYIIKNTIHSDFLKFCLRGKKYTMDDKFKISIELENTGEKAVSKSLDLNKIFITFKLERENGGDISLTNDKDIHKFYIDYVRNKNSSRELSYCDITGKLDYCVERHRGIIGNAKLISISNNDETYYGRLKSGGDIYHISYETSQRVHNMLKYLLDDTNHSSFIGEGAYVINWLSNELEKGGIKLLSEFKEGDASDGEEPRGEDIDEDEDGIADEDEATMTELGGGASRRIGAYFLGKGGEIDFKGDFNVLIIEKISNGRVSIKHFKRLSRSDAYDRLKYWYKTTEWKLGKHIKTPSVYQIVDFLYGYENDKGFLKCDKNALRRSQIERLIPCLTDSKRIPRDMVERACSRLAKNQSYKKSWDIALYIGCSLIKKYKNDYCDNFIDVEKIGEVNQLKESISFNYGRLLAIYDKVELDAVWSRNKGFNEDGSQVKEDKGGKDKKDFVRVTNASRMYNSMTRMPERTLSTLSKKLNPYFDILRKKNGGAYVFYDKEITKINAAIKELKESKEYKEGPVDKDFYIGFYHQKNLLYNKGKSSNDKQ